MTKDRDAGRYGDRARAAARILPLLTLDAWVVTIWVPILDSASNNLHSGESMRIVVTSLGRSPFEPTEAEAEFVIIWSCLLACVATAWLVDGLRLWSWATAGFGSAVLIVLAGEIADPRIIMWDGQDSDGRWIGGTEIASPAPGAVLWTIGGIALIAAGICGLSGEWRRCGHWPDRGSGENNCPRISRWFSTVPGRDGRIRVRRHRSAAERIARLLPLVSVTAWVVMIWVPIFANRASDENSVTVTSLGRHPIGFNDIDLDVVLPWTAVLVCAAVAWLIDPPLWWSVVVLLIGLVLFITMEVRMIDPPTARFLITDSSGERWGGRIVGYPDAGVSYWALGSGALVISGIAGIIGFIGDRRRPSFDCR